MTLVSSATSSAPGRARMRRSRCAAVYSRACFAISPIGASDRRASAHDCGGGEQQPGGHQEEEQAAKLPYGVIHRSQPRADLEVEWLYVRFVLVQR